MECSPARLEANRRNARLSTGPRTDEGKEKSRANAYKHGMAGDGVVLPAEDRAEVEGLARDLEARFRPSTDLDRGLVRRAATLAVRLDRCAARESAATSARVQSALADFDEAREAEAERLMATLVDEPAHSVRRLRKSPEGVDRMIAAWSMLRDDLACPAEDRWGASHRLLAENLSGRRPGDIGITRVEVLARAIGGDFTLLGAEEGAGSGDEGRIARARGRMIELIDAEIASLRAHRETLDLALIGRLRALAPSIALYDPSKPAQLAHRYEAEAERGLFRALRELRQNAGAGPSSATAPEPAGPTADRVHAEILGSFRAIEASGALPGFSARKHRPDPAKLRANHRARPVQAAPNGPRDASMVAAGRG